MQTMSMIQIAALLLLLVLTAIPLGRALAALFSAKPGGAFLERLIYRLCGIDPHIEQRWHRFALSALLFNAAGIAASYALMRLQASLPLNPAKLPAIPPDLAFNTAASFAVNADWQAYSGETTMSYFTQMAALTVQNFTAPASGMAVLAAVVRRFARNSTQTLGNFYADAVRSILYVLLPLGIAFSLFLVWQGVPQNLDAYSGAATLEGAAQTIAQGPVATQDALKLLGTNGGGFFNANSAHPFEAPTPLVNFLQCWAMLLLPASLVFAFGRMVGNRRQGRALFLAMLLMFLGGLALADWSEAGGNPLLHAAGIDRGGNMEGKEVRFGTSGSALFEMTTTATGTGAANSSLDSFMPFGGMTAMLNLMSKEVVFGGAGSGLYGMLTEVLIAVFIAGLMVGRTPEYLGKKIESKEMRLTVVISAIPVLTVLALGALSIALPAGAASISAAGPHGLSQVLYAYLSTTMSNGSAFSGFNGDTLYQNAVLGFALLIGRFLVMVPTLALAGSIGAKIRIPQSAGTMPTHGLLFVFLLIATIAIVSGLTFFPVLALGPIAEHYMMASGIAL
jgi:K+-transporting ATPase ATPase A chain